MSVLEIVDVESCRLHNCGDDIFPIANYKLEKIACSAKYIPRRQSAQLQRNLKRNLSNNRLPVCDQCIKFLKKISMLRKETKKSSYPCLLDLEILEELRPSTIKYAKKGSPGKNVASDTKMQWKDFLTFIKDKYYSGTNTSPMDISTELRSLLNVTQEMIRADMAWFSEDDYLKATKTQ